MDKNDNGGVSGMRQVTPIIGQRWLEVEVPAEIRKLPLGVPVSLCGLFMQDKAQLDRIEAKLDRLLGVLKAPDTTEVAEERRENNG